MLTNEDINKYKKLKEDQEKAKQIEQQLRAEFNVYKKNSTEIFEKWGYSSFSDLPKMEEDLNNLEAEIKEQGEKAIEYVKYINEKKQEKDNIILG